MLGRIRISGMGVSESDFTALGAIRRIRRHRMSGIVVDSQSSSRWFSHHVASRNRWKVPKGGVGCSDSDGLLTIGGGHEPQDGMVTAAHDDAVATQGTHDGLHSVLDNNVRSRDWPIRCSACGCDLPHVQYHHMTDAPIPTSHRYPYDGMRWIRAIIDALAGTRFARVGITTHANHEWSFIERNIFAALIWNDLLPPISDLGMLAAHVVHKTHTALSKEIRS
jgi:hypothetical protein